MLSWFFRKRDDAGIPVGPKVPLAPAAAGTTAPAAAGPDWVAQLKAAQGDDEVLLRIAVSATRLDIKMAAVEGLAAEAALRQAEREFRGHDRKVHRLAKQRLQAAVAQREAHVRAQALLERVAALVDEADVPINHVVELDRNWDALPADLLEPQQRARFAELRARLDAALRECGEAQQRLHRWSGDVRRLLPDWRRALVAAAEQGVAADVTRLILDTRALIDARPHVLASATSNLDTALAQALETAALVELRLTWLATQASQPAAAALSDQATGSTGATLAGPTAEQAEAPSASPADDDLPGAAAVADAVPPGAAPPLRWSDLPTLPDAELARVLEQRHASWLRELAPHPSPVGAAPPAGPTTGPRPARNEAKGPAQRPQVESLLQQAEQALTEGHLGVVQQDLQAIDAVLGTNRPEVLPDVLRGRLQALRAEAARLKGWQQWGGARAREDLVAEAEALARQTQAAADLEANDKPKLNLTHHAQAIQALRQRWKELDRLSATVSQTLWQRFDESLRNAYGPVAAQHAALKVARQENLTAREALLAGLDALPLPIGPAHATDSPDPATPLPVDTPPMEWKDVVRELHGFQLAWRKLGPVEHTVPASARPVLQQRLRGSLARIEEPLQAQQQAAAQERERLIAQAQALATRAVQSLAWNDAARQLRDLQAAWQQQARQLPLPRALESDLWARFKAATDAVFEQRDAAAATRDAELSANLVARESLLERLSGLGADTDPAAIERTLSEVDRALRSHAELPRGVGEALEARFRVARAAALQTLIAVQARHWQAQCDTLMARLAECEARETRLANEEADAGTADPGPRWAAHDDLPAAWQQALAWRWGRRPAPGPLSESEIDDVLLQLEAVLDLPSTLERQAERRQLKLRALKEAMEGRSQPAQGAAQHSAWWLAMLRQGGLTPAQRQRLLVLAVALRQAPPGTLARVSSTERSAGS